MDLTFDNIILAYSIPIFILLIVIEVFIDIKEKKELYYRKDTVASLTMGAGSVVIGAGMKILAFAMYTFIYQFKLFEIGTEWWAWVILFFADDFTFYWHHRLSHEVRLFWAAHINHHSSVKMNFGTALRQGVGERLHKYFFWLWLPLRSRSTNSSGLGAVPALFISIMELRPESCSIIEQSPSPTFKK